VPAAERPIPPRGAIGRKRLEHVNEGVLALLLALTFLELKRMFDGGVTHAGPFASCIVANRSMPLFVPSVIFLLIYRWQPVRVNVKCVG
jgi:hypothetical protein